METSNTLQNKAASAAENFKEEGRSLGNAYRGDSSFYIRWVISN